MFCSLCVGLAVTSPLWSGRLQKYSATNLKKHTTVGAVCLVTEQTECSWSLRLLTLLITFICAFFYSSLFTNLFTNSSLLVLQKTHTWDPLITGTIQAHFEAICQRRMKDMVSKVHSSRLRPTWIKAKLWQQMCDYWDSEEGVQRSQTTSKARNSERGGLGPYKTFTGQKSFLQIHQEMVIDISIYYFYEFIYFFFTFVFVICLGRGVG